MDQNALSLQWTFGFNHKLVGGVKSLCDGRRIALAYASAHSGVVYDCVQRTQKILQGHCNHISALEVSEDKKFVVTADKGPDSLIVVWDSHDGTPIRTIFNPAAHGVEALALSPDGAFLATLSAVSQDDVGSRQTLAIWEWTNEDREEPLLEQEVPVDDIQTSVGFSKDNPSELVSTGLKHVFFWSWLGNELSCYAPRIHKAKFRQTIGTFTRSAFIPESPTGQVLSATVDGDVIVWQLPNAAEDPNGQRAASKIIHLSEGPITAVETVGSYVALGGEDGAVRFYDKQLRLEAWFEDMEAGAVTSVSFSLDGVSSSFTGVGASDEGSASGDKKGGLDFSVPDFVVGTRMGYVVGMESALFDEVEAENRRGTLLLQGSSDEVHGLAAHPLKLEIAVASYSGALQLWDVDAKVLLNGRDFDASRLRPRCLAYDPNGNYLAVGFTSGTVKLLDPVSLEDVATFKTCKDPILDLCFSAEGDYLAVADADHHVVLWELEYRGGDGDELSGSAQDAPPAEPGGEGKVQGHWVYVGRRRAHSGRVTSLVFGIRDSGRQCLLSTGLDRRMVEYDLEASSPERGLCMKEESPHRVDQSAVPTACMLHPLLGTGATRDFEDRIVTANSELKLVQWNADNKACRRTSLGPSFGGSITRLMPLMPAREQRALDASAEEDPSVAQSLESRQREHCKSFFAYSTAEKVIGLGKFPLDGNPHKNMGLIAHPGDVSAMAVSHDARFLYSAGGKDQTVNVWAIHLGVIDASEAASVGGGEGQSLATGNESASGGMAPFLALLEGGEQGALHNEIIDYFYYAQLRAQGENTTAPREVTGRVPLTEIPNLMRALGFYPSEAEVSHMVNEVKYSVYTMTGEVREDLNLDEFIRLYVNHRPVAGVSKPEIEEAFKVLAAATPGGELDWASLKEQLLSHGEAFSKDNLEVCLKALVGSGDLPSADHITADAFTSQVLGFEDFDHEQTFEQAA